LTFYPWSEQVNSFTQGAGLCDYAIFVTILSVAEQRKMVDCKVFEEKMKPKIA
jgi:hypothetical protein